MIKQGLCVKSYVYIGLFNLVAMITPLSWTNRLLYRFPISKPQLAEQWVRSLGRKNFVPSTNSCLCSEHFLPNCFRDYNGKQFLREDAVPTIFSHSAKEGADGTKVRVALWSKVKHNTVVFHSSFVLKLAKDTNTSGRPYSCKLNERGRYKLGLLNKEGDKHNPGISQI